MNSVITKISQFLRKQPRWRVSVAVGIIGILAIWISTRGPAVQDEITFVAKRGPLAITVLEGGSVEAQQSLEIRSEVKGGSGTKILKIVEEGYQVTEEDVANGKVLVELDSAEIQSKLTQQEISYQTAIATLTEARQSYEIQRNQNTSTIKAAEQKAQFAKMDLEKFMGDTAFAEIVGILKLDKLEAAAAKIATGEDVEKLMLSAMETNEVWMEEEYETQSGEKATGTPQPALQPAAITPKKPKAKTVTAPMLDFSKYADTKLLGDGSAQQQLRKLEDDMLTAKQQQRLSQTKLDGTRRLHQGGFATKAELDAEEITAKNNDLKVKTADTAYNLFIKYEFQKQAQEYVSKYEEALRGLEREKKEAISKLAQSKARLKGAEGRYSIEAEERREYIAQLEKCIIKASKPGLVVYGGGSSEGYYSNNEQIREGATVRERQPIITIPDMSQMAVKVKVHESYVQKVRKGLPVQVQVDAFPDRKLTAEVTKVALLPDSNNRWTNPDLKVYQTTIVIHGTHDWLKPGMSAKVEILVTEIQDAIYIPLQSVSEIGGKHFCYVADGGVKMREIKVGEFNDEFIEIKNGLKEGEEVLLRAPDSQAGSGKNKKDKAPQEGNPPLTNAPSENSPSPAPSPEKPPASVKAGKNGKPSV